MNPPQTKPHVSAMATIADVFTSTLHCFLGPHGTEGRVAWPNFLFRSAART